MGTFLIAMSQTQNQNKIPREIELSDLRSILVVNDLVARRPERIRMVLEEEWQNGLWQLSLYDLESTRTWQVGYYIDGYEGRRAVYDKTLLMGWGGYYEDDGGKYDVKSYVIKLEGDYITINLPDEWRPNYIFKTRRLCGYGFPLLEPVYFAAYNGEYLVLNCLHGLYRFNTFDEMAGWVKEQECKQHETPIIHWYDWGVLQNNATILYGYSEPTADEVIQFLRQNLRPT
jgi:hypothetical protein